MATHTSKRIGVLAGLGVGLLGLGALVGVGFSYQQSDLPDLEPLLPTNHSNPNDRWVDTSEPTAPGKTLYRFDTVIANVGTGAWAVSRADSTSVGQPTNQIVFSGGNPGGAETAVKVADYGTANAIRYSPAAGHNHFHTQLVAAYDLLTPGGAKVASAGKNLAGFCLYDSWVLSNKPDYFPDSLSCHPNEPDYVGPIEIGLSAGWGDFYGSQLGDQWIDVTDVTPGNYQIRATVNPNGIYKESDTSSASNTVTDDVVIPGAIAAAASASTPVGQPVDIPISGTLWGNTVKSRIPGCPDTSSASCMQTATAGRLSFQASGSPSAGTVQIVDANAADTKAVVRFTPPAGFNGTATFAYTARDSRGLTSKPATVTVTVGSAATGGTGGTTGGGTTGGGTTTVKATVKLKPSFRLVHSGAKTFLAVKGTLPKSQAGRLVRVQRKSGRKITTIGAVRVARTGRFARAIPVHAHALSVRASLGSTASTKAALSSFRRVTG